MPGPVSDSYDPVWGTASNAEEVREAIREVRNLVGQMIGSPPQFILDVVRGDRGQRHVVTFTEKQLRIIRFAMGVALEEEDL